MPTYGLLGFPLSHSFSRTYFTRKFAEDGLSHTHRYLNFEIEEAIQIKKILEENPDLRGLNVTLPHKQDVIRYLDRLDPVAERIGAVNTILVAEGGTVGYNTDYLGFREDLISHLRRRGKAWFGNFWRGSITGSARNVAKPLSGVDALVLGTGGASLAILAALADLGAAVTRVSRRPGPDRVTYADLDDKTMARHRLIVNTTPLGMAPKVDGKPDIPYAALTTGHFCYDVVYNPEMTRFLELAAGRGAGTANGLGMLHGQAEASWAIWNDRV